MGAMMFFSVGKKQCLRLRQPTTTKPKTEQMTLLRLTALAMLCLVLGAGCGSEPDPADLSDPSVAEAIKQWDEEVAEDESSL